MHPRLKTMLDVSGELFDAAAAGALFVGRELRRPRDDAYSTRRPGTESPLWNALATALRAELRVRGAKARLAHMLGIPRQRLNDFLIARRRLPDAELTLQLAAWLAHRRNGRKRK
jgi:hypothetical protein